MNIIINLMNFTAKKVYCLQHHKFALLRYISLTSVGLSLKLCAIASHPAFSLATKNNRCSRIKIRCLLFSKLGQNDSRTFHRVSNYHFE